MIALHSDEKILLIKRVFWLPIAAQSAMFLIAAIIPFLMIFIFEGMLPQTAQEFIREYHVSALFVATVWAFALWICLSIRWTDYYLDVVLITNKRIVDIEQIGLFSRDVAETRLENIQDTRVEISGFLASVMHFGNLYVQTAGSAREFAIKNIGNPHEVKDLISRQCDEIAGQDRSRGA